MNKHGYEMVTTLCARIRDEYDPVAFTELLTELDALFEKLATQRARCVGFESET